MGFCHLYLQRAKSHLYARDKRLLHDSGATQSTRSSPLSDKQLLPISVEKQQLMFSDNGVVFTYHGVMTLFHFKNEAMSGAARVTLLVLSWDHRISELERFLDYMKRRHSSDLRTKL